MVTPPLQGKVVAVCCNPEPVLKAVVKKQPGKTIFKTGVMTRILQSGWVRAGDLVEVLTPVEIVNEG